MMFVVAAVLLALSAVSADPFIYNVYSSGSQSPFGNPYTRDEVYIRRPSVGGVGGNPFYSGLGNQMMMVGGGGGAGGFRDLQGLQSLQGLQGMQTLQSMQGMGGMGMQMPYGSASNMMGVGSYGSSMYKPRFAADMMMGSGQPMVLNGYPMYPKSSGYPMIIPIGMGSFGSSPTVYQGQTVSRLPFQAAQRARFF
ncbi:unnamed protein product [Caenorhabditis sp. 36 PRJEB53466]|nr:unnamed protein product [Caenorhabditis sp. 36 PRJEB53466]